MMYHDESGIDKFIALALSNGCDIEDIIRTQKPRVKLPWIVTDEDVKRYPIMARKREQWALENEGYCGASYSQYINFFKKKNRDYRPKNLHCMEEHRRLQKAI